LHRASCWQVLDGFDFLVYQLGKRRMRATGARSGAASAALLV
jgi:hypothetical protein